MEKPRIILVNNASDGMLKYGLLVSKERVTGDWMAVTVNLSLP